MLKQGADLDRMFQALADPVRRSMVERLTLGPASVSELAKPFSMSLSAVAQHLAVLEQSGLVTTQKRGRVRICSLDVEALTAAEQWLIRRRGWESRFAQLGQFLAREEK
jgi:DNA-binding transcriptional ArsR family regulator